MSIRLAVVMDPIESIKPEKDSSFAMLLAAQRRGWQCSVIDHGQLFIHDGQPCARARQLRLYDREQTWFETIDETAQKALQEFDIILMRSDPPVDRLYITSCQILALAESQGVMIANPPASLLTFNEKLASLSFPDLYPAHIVSQHPQQLREFAHRHPRIVIKPLDGMGGRGIFVTHADDPNLSVILETATDHGRRHCMAQEWLAAISEGDKRILMIDGTAVPCGLARIPQGSDHRGNLAAGGRGVGFELSASDQHICTQLAPWLRQHGIRFTGIDVIGDRLTEINITSPTCIREIDQLYGLDIAARFLDALEASPRPTPTSLPNPIPPVRRRNG